MSKQGNAIGYCRVASARQAPDSECIAQQKVRIARVAETLQLDIAHWFVQVGNQTEDNPVLELDNALAYCEVNTDVQCVIVASPDRLSRSLEWSHYWKVAFDRLGVDLRMDEGLDMDVLSPLDRFMEAIGVIMAQLDNGECKKAQQN